MATIAPSNIPPEKFRTSVFQTVTPSQPSPKKGPLRFEEGTENAPFIQSDFQRGRVADTQGLDANKSMQGVETVYKRAPDTLRERAHLGSASWVEAPAVLSEFKDGLDDGKDGTAVGGWTRAFNSGVYQKRPAVSKISNW